MPLLRITSNFEPPHSQHGLKDLSDLLCKELNKPEKFMMVLLEPQVRLMFAGSEAPALALELKSVGLPRALAKHMSGVLCAWFHENWQVAPDRIYLEFTDAPGEMWGWNGTVFDT